MSRADAAANSLIRYFQRRARRGAPEARRDWLYGPAHVPGGAWNQDALLDDVIRRAKDIGAATGFELVYVYARPPCWTCDPSAYVRDAAQAMALLRHITEHRRGERTAPAGSHNEALAGASAAYLETARRMLRVPDAPPFGDPVLARIDAAGMAN